MSKMYHYLYKITNLTNNKYYYGVHSTENLNDGYMGSGKIIKQSVKKHGKENFKKEILEYFDTVEQMYQREAEVVNENTIQDPNCYNITLGGHGLSKRGFCYVEDREGNRHLVSKNDPGLKNGAYFKLILYRDKDGKAIQTTKIDPRVKSGELIPINRGLMVAKDKNGNYLKISKDDPRLKTGELVGNTKGKVVVKDKNGNTFSVDKNNPKFLSGEYVHSTKGRITVIDNEGNTFSTSIDDPKYLNGEYKHIATGRAVVKDKDGNILTINVNDPKYLNGEYVSILKNRVPVKDKDNNYYMVDVNDPKYKSKEYIPMSTGYAMMKTNDNQIVRVPKSDHYDNLTGVTKGKVVAKNDKNEIVYTSVDNPEYQNGSLKHINANMVPVFDKEGNSMHITREEYNKNKQKYRHPLKNKISVRDKNGNTLCVDKNDPRIKTGELVGVTKGLIPCCNKDNFADRKLLTKDDPLYKTQYIPLSSLRVLVIDKNGNEYKTYKDDPRLKNNELVVKAK